jgi:putative RNA 2'-phosphotransferase
MPDEYLVRLSKTISHALRHKPEEYGLTLDAEGWVEVEDLLAALRKKRRNWRHVSQADISALMAESKKQRFELHAGRIRAFYGHSTAEKVEKQPVPPPALLYHGTTAQAAAAILREGLRSMKRQYVHLSTDEQTAHGVALRRTIQPVILQINALKAHAQGIKFYVGNQDIWLADPIPATFISITPGYFPPTRDIERSQ